VGPYSVSKARLVRRWQVLEPTRDAYTLLSRTRLASAASNDPKLTWSPAYSRVSGMLPLDAVPRFQRGKERPAHGFVRCQLETTTGGKVQMSLSSTVGLTLWNDGVPDEIKEQMILDLKPGLHTLTFQIDFDQRTDGLRCELEDVAQSTARVQIVGGK
jgi:hypothetical protein